MLSFTKKRAAWYIDLLRESRLLQEQRCQPLAALGARQARGESASSSAFLSSFLRADGKKTETRGEEKAGRKTP
jgi:hypothetical protein